MENIDLIADIGSGLVGSGEIKMWKDKQGNELTFKEFMQKWREGIEGISPLQKLKSQMWGTRISLIGIILGLFVSVYGYKNLWWVAIILLGALINTYIQYISFKQQINIFVNIEKQLAEPEIIFPEETENVIKE